MAGVGGGGGRKRRFDFTGAEAPPQAAKVIKISTDVYPDPEPEEAAIPWSGSIAARLQQVKATRAAPVKTFMNAEGKLVDEHGREIEQDTTPVATLGINRKRKLPKAAAAGAAAAPEPEPEDSGFYDKALDVVGRTAAAGNRKGAIKLTDAEPSGEVSRYKQEGERLRLIEEQRREYREKRMLVDEAFEKGETVAGIEAPAAPAAPVKELDTFGLPVPDAEWWDAVLLVTQSYADVREDQTLDPMAWRLKHKLINHNYVEHPVPVCGQHVEVNLPPQPLKLTVKERKKRRKQMRIAREKEKQEQVQLGLIPPPPPKVKISNMARVLLQDYVQDPTAIERLTREEMASRVTRHEERNKERMLSVDDRRQKTIEKFQKEATTDPLTSVYRIDKLHSNRALFKIKINAQQLYLTGFLVTTESGLNMVIVEGGAAPMRKYDALVTRRTDYELEEGKTAADNASQVWTGRTGKQKFSEFKQVNFADEEKARSYLVSMGCGAYWDMVLQGQRQVSEVTCKELFG